jgi:hypothetical protein
MIGYAQYIGKHTGGTLDKKYVGSGVVLKSFYKKHGHTRFNVELLVPCTSQDMMNVEETRILEEHDAYNPNNKKFVNIIPGENDPNYMKIISKFSKGRAGRRKFNNGVRKFLRKRMRS